MFDDRVVEAAQLGVNNPINDLERQELEELRRMREAILDLDEWNLSSPAFDDGYNYCRQVVQMIARDSQTITPWGSLVEGS